MTSCAALSSGVQSHHHAVFMLHHHAVFMLHHHAVSMLHHHAVSMLHHHAVFMLYHHAVFKLNICASYTKEILTELAKQPQTGLPSPACVFWTAQPAHALGRLVSESACERKDPGSNPAADMVDAARNTVWDLGKQPNNYRSNYPTQEWARRDLSGTAITSLPTLGLESLESLILVDTFTLKTFPSVYSFKSIRRAELTYSYHCCAFQFPKIHDPEEHKRQEEEMRRHSEKHCTDTAGLSVVTARPDGEGTSFDELQIEREHLSSDSVASSEAEFHRWGDIYTPLDADHESLDDDLRRERGTAIVRSVGSSANNSGQLGHPSVDESFPHFVLDSFPHKEGFADIIESDGIVGPFLTGGFLEDNGFSSVIHKENLVPKNFAYDTSSYNVHQDSSSVFHTVSFVARNLTSVVCGQLPKNYLEVQCRPAPDAFNPCEDVMHNYSLRFAVWLVVITAVFGNLAVMIVLLSSRYKMTVSKFLICNLATADLCMGVYLMMIAAVDMHTRGRYFNHALDWQRG
ncbi:G protein-coupled receptor rhodopsin-like [Trinorchestia longiramus]|nr:G protein-coupled receptor rhodopsin-like [Trinorchestia longiramus]